jgi:hypothetical protein
MIQPEDIRRKAESLYREYVQAWLSGNEAFFPREIRGRKTPRSRDLAAANNAVRSLREGSKEAAGFGYTVQWREIRSRTFGQNQFPERILFESADDLLKFLDRKHEFDAFSRAATRLGSQFPVLREWIRTNSQKVHENAPDLDGLLEVLHWFREHPRPNMYARELPLPIDTKFIMRHEELLCEWFDLVLPPHSIRADEDHFERRYGLRYCQPHLFVRFLDPLLQANAGFPCDELSLPLDALDRFTVPIERVFVVENKVNLLTLPAVKGSLALGGLGNGVTLLRYIGWLQSTPVSYWGDIDVEGFMILSMLRAIYPHVHSFLMDRATMDRHQRTAIQGTGRKPSTPSHLYDEERSLFEHCRENNIRFEQERIPQSEVLAAMTLNAADSPARGSATDTFQRFRKL